MNERTPDHRTNKPVRKARPNRLRLGLVSSFAFEKRKKVASSRATRIAKLRAELLKAIRAKESPTTIRKLRARIRLLEAAHSVSKKHGAYRHYGRRHLYPLVLEGLRKNQDLVPQAVVSRPIGTFVDRGKGRLVRSSDSFDEYEGVAYMLAGTPFTVMHYRGHPDRTSTIYLPRDIEDLDRITRTISNIVQTFGLPLSAIAWQRKDDPEL